MTTENKIEKAIREHYLAFLDAKNSSPAYSSFTNRSLIGNLKWDINFGSYTEAEDQDGQSHPFDFVGASKALLADFRGLDIEEPQGWDNMAEGLIMESFQRFVESNAKQYEEMAKEDKYFEGLTEEELKQDSYNRAADLAGDCYVELQSPLEYLLGRELFKTIGLW